MAGEEQHISREEILDLMKKKDAIEDELLELQEWLKAEKNIGMTEPLVDSEGYPRSDIDVYQVRRTRHRVNCLQNDHKTLMKEIEDKLFKYHAQQKLCSGEKHEDETLEKSVISLPSAFVSINHVEKNSPAEAAKLQFGDKIVKFGSITATNFSKLSDIAAVVQHSIGKTISVEVLRDGKVTRLSLVPKSWSGQGFLGCKLVPS